MLLNFFSDLHNFQLTLCAPVGLYKDKVTILTLPSPQCTSTISPQICLKFLFISIFQSFLLWVSKQKPLTFDSSLVCTWQETWNLELNFHVASYGLFWILIDANLPKRRILKWSKLFALCKIGFSSLQSLYWQIN